MEWDELMRNAADISNYFDGTSATRKSMQFGSFNGAFQSIYGHHTLVLYERNPAPNSTFTPDSIAIQRATWQGLMDAKDCTGEVFISTDLLSHRVARQYEDIGNHVMDHLRREATSDSTYNELFKMVKDFLKDFKNNDSGDYFIYYNIFLFCIPLYVTQFKLRNISIAFSNNPSM